MCRRRKLLSNTHSPSSTNPPAASTSSLLRRGVTERQVASVGGGLAVGSPRRFERPLSLATGTGPYRRTPRVSQARRRVPATTTWWSRGGLVTISFWRLPDQQWRP